MPQIVKNYKNIQTAKHDYLNDTYVVDKLLRLSDCCNEDWTFGDYPYETDKDVVISVVRKLILCGYTEEEILVIYKEWDVDMLYDFSPIYNHCDSLISNKDPIKKLNRLAGVVRLNDLLLQRLYDVILSKCYYRTTTDMIIYKTDMRRLSTISNWSTLQNRLDQLVEAGLISMTETEGMNEMTGIRFPLYTYHVITEDLITNDLVTILDTPATPYRLTNDVQREAALNTVLKETYRIVQVLNGEMSSKDISKMTNIAINPTRRYLKKLTELGITAMTKKGRTVSYALTANHTSVFDTLIADKIKKITDRIDNQFGVLGSYSTKQSVKNMLGKTYTSEKVEWAMEKAYETYGIEFDMWLLNLSATELSNKIISEIMED